MGYDLTWCFAASRRQLWGSQQNGALGMLDRCSLLDRPGGRGPVTSAQTHGQPALLGSGRENLDAQTVIAGRGLGHDGHRYLLSVPKPCPGRSAHSLSRGPRGCAGDKDQGRSPRREPGLHAGVEHPTLSSTFPHMPQLVSRQPGRWRGRVSHVC